MGHSATASIPVKEMSTSPILLSGAYSMLHLFTSIALPCLFEVNRHQGRKKSRTWYYVLAWNNGATRSWVLSSDQSLSHNDRAWVSHWQMVSLSTGKRTMMPAAGEITDGLAGSNIGVLCDSLCMDPFLWLASSDVDGYNGNKVSWAPVLSKFISYIPED